MDFFQVGTPLEEMKFQAFIESKKEKEIVKMNTSLNQSNSKSYQSSDQRTQAIIDMNSSKAHILTYYFRNLRKYNNIKMMKYFLEL